MCLSVRKFGLLNKCLAALSASAAAGPMNRATSMSTVLLDTVPLNAQVSATGPIALPFVPHFLPHMPHGLCSECWMHFVRYKDFIGTFPLTLHGSCQGLQFEWRQAH